MDYWLPYLLLKSLRILLAESRALINQIKSNLRIDGFFTFTCALSFASLMLYQV